MRVSLKLREMVWEATAADARDLARMLHQFNLEFGEPSPGEAFLASRVEALIDDGSKSYLLARSEEGRTGGTSGDPEGFAQVDFRPTVWSEGPVALLEELYVRPAKRGVGLGRELMDVVLGLSSERGAAMVEVVTGEDDKAARGLYESTGFRNRIEGEDQTGALYYELEL